ncbi:exodeoxyribonuclease VII large subunit [Demequina lutea]|uniref:Exodeoxyribonuclease 7 large subunit n=1 Tax=Demequina lutea TaxID=431489 RepID=A0A7Y9ZCY1_9MICO|nr:exodeoxyribonuclease VII large subunit [Demequina lutea]NYI42288.1 exodeoxyribonuclease VII large subunit [Demequina lutea]
MTHSLNERDGAVLPNSALPNPALPAARASLPATAAETSAERPWPVRHLSPKIGEYVARISPVWVEGQVLNVKRWKHLVFLTLRDTDENMSLKATIPWAQAEAMGIPLDDGARVVLHAQPQWWTRSGDLQMVADEARAVGLGDLLARIEALKNALGAEGLFAPDRKVPLPVIPRRIGLVVATQGDAEHDVVTNALLRWPAARFEIRRVTVQGPRAVPEVVKAMRELDAIEDVDVIVVARGGGSLEDLLAFSDESLVRAAAAIVTPLVSAIGHELDSPLLDLVADYRASTPTDAGKHVVPDAALERDRLAGARALMLGALSSRLGRERERITDLRSRPVLAQPVRMLAPHRDVVSLARSGLRAAVSGAIARARSDTSTSVAALNALSPQSTLERGYAVVRTEKGDIVRAHNDVAVGGHLSIRLARGNLDADVTAVSAPS